jgi:hypothetical protein
MKGTEKQIKWAEEIIAEYTAKLTLYAETASDDMYATDDPFSEIRQAAALARSYSIKRADAIAAAAKLATVTDAGWIITCLAPKTRGYHHRDVQRFLAS